MPSGGTPPNVGGALERYYEQLVSSGKTNDAVAEEVVRTGNLPENGRECLLCDVPQDLELLYEDDTCYVLSLDVTKGHDVRTLVAMNEHGRPPIDPQPYRERLLDETAARIRDGWMVIYARHGTFSGHYHLVASDLAGDDLAGMHDAALYHVENGQYGEPFWERSAAERTHTGRILLWDGEKARAGTKI